jgi:hypothetical protein
VPESPALKHPAELPRTVDPQARRKGPIISIDARAGFLLTKSLHPSATLAMPHGFVYPCLRTI